MVMRCKAVYPGTLVLVAIALASFLFIVPRSGTRAQTSAPCCTEIGPRELDFPYYALNNGFNSTLFLVSDSPDPIDFILAIHNLAGQTVLSSSMTIQPGAKLPIDLRGLLVQLSADPSGTFAEGSVSVYFEGTIMPLVGQLTLANPALHWSQEAEMVENDPGRSDIPTVLNGTWWGLSGGRDARIMVTNTSGNLQVADVFLNFDGQQHQSPAVVFNPHETKILSVADLLSKLSLSPAQEPQGSITLVQQGANPALIAQGRVTDPVTGFSTTLEFPDPARQKVSSLHASGIPVGSPSADSPFAGDGTFTPHVLASNLSNGPETVTVTVEYPQRDAQGTAAKAVLAPIGTKEFDGESGTSVAQTALASFQVPAYSTVDFSLFAELGQLPLPLPYASVRIQYSGAPGSVIAQVSSVDEAQDLVVDARTMNEGDGWAGSGSNPWHLDSQTESILFLTDESDMPARIGFHVVANGVTYYLTNLKLDPHETRAINIRKLRDAQNTDFLKNRIPAGASDGSVEWNRIDNVAVTGRVVVIQKNQGTASAYDCCMCPCPESYQSLSVIPSSAYLTIGGSVLLGAMGAYQACNHGPIDYIDDSYWTTWTSGTTSVAVMNSGTHGEVDGVAVGTSTITVRYSDYVYTYNGVYCNGSLTPHLVYATAYVCGLSISSPSSNQVYNMGGSNYNQATVSLNATSSCSGTANWTLNFKYTTQNGSSYTGSATTSSTIGQSANYITPVAKGGQVNAQVQATLAGHSFTQSVTFYVLGTAIPDPTITSRLIGLYSGTTPHLLTGIAKAESSYKQFNDETEMAFFGKWPYGNAANQYTPADSYVGLMQVPNGMVNGFDWLTNTTAGENVFQGSLTSATNYVSNQQSLHPQLPGLSGQELEKEALSFYGGFSTRYHLVNSSGNGWVTTTRSDLLTYVANVFNDIQ
jgi:hypothetical protein